MIVDVSDEWCSIWRQSCLSKDEIIFSFYVKFQRKTHPYMIPMIKVRLSQRLKLYTESYASNHPPNLSVAKYQIGTIMCGRNIKISS